MFKIYTSTKDILKFFFLLIRVYHKRIYLHYGGEGFKIQHAVFHFSCSILCVVTSQILPGFSLNPNSRLRAYICLFFLCRPGFSIHWLNVLPCYRIVFFLILEMLLYCKFRLPRWNKKGISSRTSQLNLKKKWVCQKMKDAVSMFSALLTQKERRYFS